MNHQENPLLSKENKHRRKAIPFDKIKLEHFMPAVDTALAEAKERVMKIRESSEPPTFENSFIPLDSANEHLYYVTGIYFALHSAESDGEFKKLAQEISPRLAQYRSWISTDKLMFHRIKTVYDNEVKDKEAPKIPDDLSDRESLKRCERYRIIENSYKSFIRNGAMLNDEDKAKLIEINMQLSKLSPKFSENVLNATNKYELHLTEKEEVEGIPENTLKAAAFMAKKKNKEGGWLFNLQPSSFIPLLTYCKNREVREKIHKAYTSRAFKDDFDNQENILQIIKLRDKRAKLLGYNNHAHYVLEERMAESIDNAGTFLEKIYRVSYPAAKEEVAETAAFAGELDGLTDFQAWDMGYYANKLKEKRYAYDPEELRPWFKLEAVIDGIFRIAGKLYGIKFKQVDDIPVYHSDVTTYEAFDENDDYLGLLYIDFTPRETKRGGAWMNPLQIQGTYSDGMRRPHVSIVGSLTPSSDEMPALLRFDEVRTLFHEFGHALHTLLSDCYFKSVASPHCLWDFVELPSQIMENWLLEKEALNLFAKHYETGEPLPEELLDKVIAAKNFQSGNANLRQVQYGTIDFAWHTTEPDKIEDVDAFEKQAVKKMQILPRPEGVNFSCGFSHIFAGGYSAGYYSYKWAESLEADAWSLFAEKGIFNQDVANDFRRYILARGNSFHPMELFIAFRGRKPDPEAMLKRAGLI